MKSKSGFTLVEILIVVVILGILAAIVIPQFTDASTEAKLSSLAADLQTMRSQIELYKIQHNDQLPDCNSLENFTACMTEKTDQDGNVNDSYKYGPYLGKIPSNQFVSGDDSFDITFVDSGNCTGTGLTGWWMRKDTGEFRANSLASKYPKHADL